jgi:hypothetical protein
MKTKSRKEAIDNHCKECIYDPLESGTWREQVEHCTMKQCSLYEFRPRSRSKRIIPIQAVE